MAIILGILKWIGIVILILLGIILTLLLLVLLVPIRYRAEGSYYGKLKGRASVSWLLSILSLQASYEEEAEVCVRVFGIRIGGPEKKRKRRKKRRAGKKAEVGNAADVEKPGPEKFKPVETEPAAVPAAPEMKTDTPEMETAAPKTESAAPETESAAPKQPKPAKKKQWQFENPLKKIRVTFRRFCDKLKALKDKKEAILNFIKNEENRKTFRLLKKQVVRLLKHILPRTIQGKVRFGFDDPYTTGQVLTYLSPFYGLYAKKLQLIPVFEEAILEGEVNLKGHIRIGTILVIGIRVLFDQNFRYLWKKWREA